MKHSVLLVNSFLNSAIFFKYINNLIFLTIKFKIEKLCYNVAFYWKKHGLGVFASSLLEAVHKIRPLVGLYLYIIKKKKRKIIKICPHYMSFISRWHKAVYWLVKAVAGRHESKLYFRMVNEMFNILWLNKSWAIRQKLRYYKIILLHKSSRHYKW